MDKKCWLDVNHSNRLGKDKSELNRISWSSGIERVGYTIKILIICCK